MRIGGDRVHACRAVPRVLPALPDTKHPELGHFLPVRPAVARDVQRSRLRPRVQQLRVARRDGQGADDVAIQRPGHLHPRTALILAPPHAVTTDGGVETAAGGNDGANVVALEMTLLNLGRSLAVHPANYVQATLRPH